MIKADVVVENKLWKRKIKLPNIYIKKKIRKISQFYLTKKKQLLLTILLTGNSKMKYLNKKFRNKKKTTDVLSFPFCEKKERNVKNNLKSVYLGDIAINYKIINQRSKKSNFNYEFDKMWVHGYLHLLGFDHKNVKDYKVMKRIEDRILKIL